MHRELTGGILAVVLGAGVLHAVWNALIKSARDKLLAFAWIGLGLSGAGGVAVCFTGLPARPALAFAFASAAIHILYDLALMRAYRLGAFNQMYPVARGSAPLLVAAGAYVFAGESPDALAMAGVVVLGVGLMSLAFSSGRLEPSERPALAAALLTGLTIATYTLVDGLGVRRAGDPFAYMALLFLLEGPVFLAAGALSRPRGTWFADQLAWRGLSAGLLSVVAYGAVLWAQTKAPLAEVSALRETGVISAAVIGAVFFKEGFGYRRFGAAAVVALGIILISL